MASWREESWKKLKPKCKGCMYQGADLPCEYILITGKSTQSQGAHIDPEGPGGCELYKKGKKISQVAPLSFVGSTVSHQRMICPCLLLAEKATDRLWHDMIWCGSGGGFLTR